MEKDLFIPSQEEVLNWAEEEWKQYASYLETFPAEILLEIFSYLDNDSLRSLCTVNKFFQRFCLMNPTIAEILPEEILLEILDYLDIASLRNLCSVNKFFQRFCLDPRIVKKLHLVDKYRWQSKQSRRSDRASIHFIPRGWSELLDSDEWEDVTFFEEEQDRVLSYLREQNSDLRRGDILVVASQLEEEERTNKGKFAFDGDKIINWNRDPYAEVYFLPTEFQVISEFPLHYWIDAFDDPREMHVPWDIRQHIPEIQEMLKRFTYQEEGLERVNIFSFEDDFGTMFYIVGFSDDIFFEDPQLIYFEVRKPFPKSSVSYLNENNTLFVPIIYTPFD